MNDHIKNGRRMEKNLLTACYVPDIYMDYPFSLHNSIVNRWGQWYLLTQPYSDSIHMNFIPFSEFQIYLQWSNSLLLGIKYYRMPF